MLSFKNGVMKLAHCSIRLSSGLLLPKVHASMRTPLICGLLTKYDSLVDGKQPKRNVGFFTNLTANDLWNSATGVSNPGRKRGRGRGAGAVRRRDLNRGQQIGVGKVNMVFPGLNTPVIRGAEIVRQEELPKNMERESKLQQIRSELATPRRNKISSLERGWSGNKLPGRRLGPPDPIDFETFDGFDTIALELKTVFSMTATAGRTRHISCFVVTGNGQGLAGFGLGKGNSGLAAINQSKRRASLRLMYVERADDHTVFHDFFTRFAKVRIFVERRPRGHGLHCHRAIREICKMVGIKDLYAKVEGPTDNVQNIAKAFFLGLLRQRTHQQLAEEKRLHLVELRSEEDNYPRVVASPEAGARTRDQIPPSEELDFNLHIFEGKVPLKIPPKLPFYMKLPCYQKHLNANKHMKNHDQVRVQLGAEYGEVRSFLADKYPECRAMSAQVWAEWKRSREAEQEDQDI